MLVVADGDIFPNFQYWRLAVYILLKYNIDYKFY